MGHGKPGVTFSHGQKGGTLLFFSNFRRFFTGPASAGFFASLGKNIQHEFRDRLLDLGSGRNPRNDFFAKSVVGIDLVESAETGVIASNLSSGPIPFGDESFGIITAYDFLEHVPRLVVDGDSVRFPFVELMNEVHRTLRPGGYFFSLTPAFPSDEAFQDPTHVNFMTRKTFRLYFCEEQAWARQYGFIGNFQIIREGWRSSHRYTLLRRNA